MLKRHLKRLNAPRNWPIKRKNIDFIAKPMPGPHAIDQCITLNILLKDILKYCGTTKEVKRILQEGDVLVDKRKRKDHKFPVGVMDIVEIPKTKENYMIVLGKNKKVELVKISDKESENKICKIIGKKILKKGIIQLNLYDGKNLFIKDEKCRVGDSIILSLKDNKINSIVKFEKGVSVYVADGNYAGSYGVLKDVKDDSRNSIVTIKTDKEEIETSKKHVFVVDKKLFKK